ncbi:MAG: alkaline shock response membrane anchor protein AmaP [Candidatus Omnitrophica bacterium]|nr:alkaline shock response membrane anchor protein AmaP [Candidatus Omnitrophota bacterium]
MNTIKALFVVIYTLLIVVFGTFLIAAAIQLITLDDIMNFVGYIYQSTNSRLITACIGLGIALLGIVLGQYSLTRLKKAHILHFDGEDGPTSIALSAIEDIIKRTLSDNDEVKDPKIIIAAKRKKLVVSLKVQLVGNFSIQELSKILRAEITSKLQKLLGQQYHIVVKLHIAKIDKKEAETASDFQENRRLPFPEYPEE